MTSKGIGTLKKYRITGYVEYAVETIVDADSEEKAIEKFEGDLTLRDVKIKGGEGFVVATIEKIK